MNQVQLARVIEILCRERILGAKLNRYPGETRNLNINLLQCLRGMLNLQGFHCLLDEVGDGCC